MRMLYSMPCQRFYRKSYFLLKASILNRVDALLDKLEFDLMTRRNYYELFLFNFLDTMVLNDQ